MSDMDLKYGDVALRARESYVNKFKAELNKNMTDSALRLSKLIEIVPNWETYLTPKQLEAAKRYVKTYNAYEVDYQLKLTPGTTHQRLFGNKSSAGAIGRLERAYSVLKEAGYFEKQEQIIEAQRVQSKTQLMASERTIELIRDLLQLANDVPNYDTFLSGTQTRYLGEFIRLRSFKATANALGINESSLRQVLLGNVLSKLHEEQKSRMVNSWEEL